MNPKSHLAYFWKNARLKHRLSLHNEHGGQEVWYVHISPLRALLVLLAALLLLFLLVMLLVAYTPIVDLIPGYPGGKAREMLIENIVRLDSMESELGSMQLYVDNVALIMEGKTPIVRSILGQQEDSLAADARPVPRTEADSVLRAQMEGPSPYRLSDVPESSAGATRESLTLLSPVKGVVATHFAPREGRYGVELATDTDTPVMAVRDGTLVSSVFSPSGGYVIGIQHADNTLSVYKRAARVTTQVGAHVRGGEVIGYTGEGREGYFELELWIAGAPVNPESYIVF